MSAHIFLFIMSVKNIEVYICLRFIVDKIELHSLVS